MTAAATTGAIDHSLRWWFGNHEMRINNIKLLATIAVRLYIFPRRFEITAVGGGIVVVVEICISYQRRKFRDDGRTGRVQERRRRSSKRGRQTDRRLARKLLCRLIIGSSSSSQDAAARAPTSRAIIKFIANQLPSPSCAEREKVRRQLLLLLHFNKL